MDKYFFENIQLIQVLFYEHLPPLYAVDMKNKNPTIILNYWYWMMLPIQPQGVLMCETGIYYFCCIFKGSNALNATDIDRAHLLM